MSLPIVMTAAGAQPQSPTSLNQQIITLATTYDPGLTANLPGTLIEDIASTDTAALVLCDQAQVELVNSITPLGANLFILNQQGQLCGVSQGVGSNTSVYVVFSGTPGYVIPQGIIVTDGTYQYVTQSASVVNSTGVSASVYCVATVSGSWAVPANAVNVIASSIPAGITLTVDNPLPGIPSTTAQSAEDYRAQVINSYTVGPSGTVSAIKSAVLKVPGVVQNLVSVRQNTYYTPSKWEVIVGGGDPTAVANAIWASCGDPNTLCGSTMLVQAITKANPGKVTVNLVHGFTAGQVVYITGIVGMTALNGVPLTVTPVVGDPYSFTIGVNTTSYATYISGGIVSTSSSYITIPRDEFVTIYDTPDSYVIPYVVPIQQSTQVQVTWNVASSLVVSNLAITQLGAPAIQAYVNSLYPGQPINEYELQYIFQEAIVSIVPTPLVTHIAIQVTIDGVIVAPIAGTGTVVGDPEGYYYSLVSDITFVQG
jgi:Ubiquitin-activating enzyme E1 FCCH domain/Baseplate J-like protein